MTPLKGTFKLKPLRKKRLTWGVAGCGKFAESTFLPALALLKKSELAAVYSSDPERARFIKNKFYAGKAYNDYDEFLKGDFEVVYIASANADHYDQVIKAARAGKHILCEKPLAVNLQQATEMVNTCHENGVFLAMNYVYRFHPLAIKTKELIDEGYLGKIISIHAAFNIDYPPNDNFRYDREKSGGGALWDLGTHLIDLMLYFGGEAEDATGFTDNIIYKSGVEDYAGGIIKFKRSGYGYLSTSFCAGKAFNKFVITGHKGSVALYNFIGKTAGYSRMTLNLEGEVMKSFRRRAYKQSHLLRAVQKAFLSGTAPKSRGIDGLNNIRIMEKMSDKWTTDEN